MFHEDAVESGEHAGGVAQRGTAQTEARCHPSTLVRHQPEDGVDRFGDDGVRVLRRQLFDGRSAAGAGYHHRAPVVPVHGHRHVHLAADVRQRLDQYGLYRHAAGVSLVGDQSGTQQAVGKAAGFIRAADDFDAAGQATATSVNLSFDGGPAAECGGGGGGFVRGVRQTTIGHRNTVAGEYCLGLILMEFHGANHCAASIGGRQRAAGRGQTHHSIG